MPYLASPPESPPSAVILPAEKSVHSSPLASDFSGAASSQTATMGALELSAPAKSSERPPSPISTSDFLKQAGASQARFLIAPDPINEAKTDDWKSDVQTPPTRYKISAGVAFNPLLGEAVSQEKTFIQQKESPDPASLVQVFESAPLPPAYSFSGVVGKLPGVSEASLISSLDDVIHLDELPRNLSLANLSVRVRNAGAQPPFFRGYFPAETAQLPSITPNVQPAIRSGDVPLQSLPTTPTFPAPDRPLPNGDRPVYSFPEQPPDTAQPQKPVAPEGQGNGGTPPTVATPKTAPQVVELTADRQEYDEQRKIFTAEGKVLMRYQGGLLDADRLQVNLDNRVAVAEGNVALTRGGQVLRGQRLEYNFVQGVGTILNARGEIFLASNNSDLGPDLAGNTGAGTALGRPVSDRVTSAQPTQYKGTTGGASFGFGFGRDISRVPGGLPNGGRVRRLRFEAERIDFTPEGWVAKKIQITNDPFSPPQLVLEADQAKLTRLSPLQDELVATRPRLLFDQTVRIPIPFSRTILDRSERQPPLYQFGFDDEDRGGFFVQFPFELITTEKFQFSLSPQIYIQRAITDSDSVFSADNFGFVSRLRYIISPWTTLRGRASLTSLDLDEAQNNLRASLRLTQYIGLNTLALEYSYRDRLFNGSLGFQTVQSSLGAVFSSPTFLLGNSGISMRYQAGFQYINADTDRTELLEPDRENNRVDLGRFQAYAAFGKSFSLWSGKPLPATPDQGLRYSPVPITPYISLGLGLTGVSSTYTNGDSQNNLVASVGLYGQFGHFAKKFLDYTGFSITYYQTIGSGQSPFLFDRSVDNRVVAFGFTQQLYGPIRLTVQSSINLDSTAEISTDYILEYSRRAYGILVRYNPVLEIGSINLRVTEFNWTGGTQPFAGSDVTPVQSGIRLGSPDD
ncbi:DUF3769 domain-containing protein [Kovacikia minuta CCNUW1]|uniref:DUF3769 domain-containing protein n=1 Tax=Kovacikia minuta TaxID=2931930 RepID=UPI001CCD3FCE|nr:DUF3769 domain-containing protein [Kovacikia minuta]UBF27632.1 DUF3769 domain-containing protein [Kovacikia minuta CCNUW1]